LSFPWPLFLSISWSKGIGPAKLKDKGMPCHTVSAASEINLWKMNSNAHNGISRRILSGTLGSVYQLM
jgi:hypothetical protein